MAITRDDFKNIPSSGVIPDDRVPARAFAVSYAFTYTGSPNLSTFNHTFTGKIILHFSDSSGGVKYVIEIEQTYNLFIFPLAPGLVLYTWNWVPSAEKISGRKGEAPDAPPMTTLGLGTFGVEPAEGSGSSDGEVIVDSRFYSGIFTERLSRGDKVKIKFHNLSAGFVVSRASLQLATERGAPAAFVIRDPRTGETWLLYVRGQSVRCAVDRRSESFVLKETDPIVKVGDATLVQGMRRGADLYAVVGLGDSLVLCVSRNEGQDWEELDMASIKINLLAATMAGSGSIAVYGTSPLMFSDAETHEEVAIGDVVATVLRLSGDKVKARPLRKVAGTNLPTDEVVGLVEDNGILLLVAQDEDSVRVLRSTNQLNSLTELIPA